jgi:hypothetical protein
MEFKTELITPAYAATLLRGNTDNRRPDRNRVKKYASEMQAGRWKMTHQAVAVAADGRIVDGQHRLMAIVESGQAIDMLVAHNADPATFGVVDQGKVRSGSDVFTIGGLKGPNISAIARLVYLYEHHFHENKWASCGDKITSQMLFDWAQSPLPEHPELCIGDVLKTAAKLETKFRKEIKGLGSVVGAAVACAELYGGIDANQAFTLVFEPLMTCIGLSPGTPVYALHRVLSKRADKRVEGAFQEINRSGIETNRARLSALLTVIDDAFEQRSRQSYSFPIGQPMKNIAS